MPLISCIECGQVCEKGLKGRCPDCRKIPMRHRLSPEEAGYDKAFRRIARKAKRLQPWCLWCGHRGSASNPLCCDHKEETWVKIARGEKLTVLDFDVLCRDCNSRKGKARDLTFNRE